MVVRSARPRPVPTGVKRLRGTERRRLLLDAARRVVLAHGVAGVTMDRVATEATVSKALVYQHFANSSEILVALLAEELARVDPAIDGTVAADSFEGRVRESARAFLEAMAGDSILHQLLVQAAAEPALERETAAFRTRSIAYWSAQARRDHDLTVEDADLLAAMLLAGYDGIATYWYRRDTDLQRTVDLFTAAVMGAVERIASR